MKTGKTCRVMLVGDLILDEPKPDRFFDASRHLLRTADIAIGHVVGHHADILRGIETYRGRPIFHGLGNFVTVTRALSVTTSPQRRAWAARRRTLFGFEPDPKMPAYPFHPQPGTPWSPSLM